MTTRRTAIPPGHPPAQAAEGASVARGPTARAVVLGLALIPLNIWWLVQIECVRWSDYPTVIALFFNAIGLLLVLQAFSGLARRFWPRLALSRGELLTVYAMVVAATCIAGHDQLQILLGTLPYIFQGATPENRWADLLHPNLPLHLLPGDQGRAIAHLYGGWSTLYQPAHLAAWLLPTLWWCGFVAVLVFATLCLGAIFRRQWDYERLSYPIAEIPLLMTEARRGLFHDPVMWMGFGLAFILRLLAFVHFFFPAFPAPRLGVIYYDFQDMPWRQATYLPFSTTPHIYGLSYLLPQQLAFSVWFFLLLGLAQLVISAVLGYGKVESVEFLHQQQLGASLGVMGFVLWAARRHLRQVWEQTTGRRPAQPGEPLPYPVAVWGVVAALGALVIFGNLAGMRTWVALIFFGSLLVMILLTARIRAEFGLPTFNLAQGIGDAVQRVGGSAIHTPAEHTSFALLWWLKRTYRQFPLPNYMDAFRLAERSGIALPPMTIVLQAATTLGAVVFFWLYLREAYHLGLDSAKFVGPAVLAFGRPPWVAAATALRMPQAPQPSALAAYLLGLGIVAVLSVFHARFLWWPFHPAGYLMLASGGTMRIWLAVLVTWLIKGAILRYGGLQLYQRSFSFFLGLVLGDYLAGFLRTLVDLAFRLYLPAHSGLVGG